MFGRNYINGSVKCLGVPKFLRNDGPPWNLNLLDPYDNWVGRGSSTSPNLGSVYGGYLDVVYVNWNHPARVLPIYHLDIIENTRSAAHRTRDDILMENRTYRMQILSNCRNPIRGRLLNRQDDALDDRWYLSELFQPKMGQFT